MPAIKIEFCIRRHREKISIFESKTCLRIKLFINCQNKYSSRNNKIALHLENSFPAWPTSGKKMATGEKKR